MDAALDADNAFDVALPLRAVELLGWREDRNGAALVAAARGIMGFMGAVWRLFGGNLGRFFKQCRLVAFDLDDQADCGLFGNLEVFF
jgi:hypothetical protein